MERGEVTQWDGSRGQIAIEGSGQEVQVYSSGVMDDIRVGDRVVFSVTEGAAGPAATNVRLA